MGEKITLEEINNNNMCNELLNLGPWSKLNEAHSVFKSCCVGVNVLYYWLPGVLWSVLLGNLY